jgi:hypothetical protein
MLRRRNCSSTPRRPQPFAQFIAPLAWATLASVFTSQAKKLPTVQELNFMDEDGSTGTSGSNRILLPGAEGKLALNLTLPDKHSVLHKLISYGLQGASLTAPLFALPAISVPAIKAFTSFYTTLVQNAGFIIRSPLKDVVASYGAVDSGNMHADALKLVTGQYVIVPARSTAAISRPDGQPQNGERIPGSKDDRQQCRPHDRCAECLAWRDVCHTEGERAACQRRGHARRAEEQAVAQEAGGRGRRRVLWRL